MSIHNKKKKKISQPSAVQNQTEKAKTKEKPKEKKEKKKKKEIGRASCRERV